METGGGNECSAAAARSPRCAQPQPQRAHAGPCSRQGAQCPVHVGRAMEAHSSGSTASLRSMHSRSSIAQWRARAPHSPPRPAWDRSTETHALFQLSLIFCVDPFAMSSSSSDSEGGAHRSAPSDSEQDRSNSSDSDSGSDDGAPAEATMGKAAMRKAAAAARRAEGMSTGQDTHTRVKHSDATARMRVSLSMACTHSGPSRSSSCHRARGRSAGRPRSAAC